MKTTQKQTEEISHLNSWIPTISKRTVWNRRRHSNYLTQFRFSN